MKIVICCREVKRKIEGSFRLLARGGDLKRLVEAIEAKRGGGRWGDMAYGWIEVHAGLDPGPVDTPPRGWDE